MSWEQIITQFWPLVMLPVARFGLPIVIRWAYEMIESIRRQQPSWQVSILLDSAHYAVSLVEQAASQVEMDSSEKKSMAMQSAQRYLELQAVQADIQDIDDAIESTLGTERLM